MNIIKKNLIKILSSFLMIYSPFLLADSQESAFVDAEKDFIEGDGKLFGKKSYYYVGNEEFETISAEAFQDNFIKGEKDLLSLPMNGNQFWVKIIFANKTPRDEQVYFFSDLNIVRDLSIYNKSLIKTLQHKDNFRKRIVPLNIKANSLSTYYIKRLSYSAQRQDFSFWKDKNKLVNYIIENQRNHDIIISIFSMSLFFTVMIFVSYRSKLYIYYSFYLLFWGMLTSTLWAITYVPFTDYFIVITAFLAAISTGLFSLHFLSLKGRLRKILLLIISTYILFIFYSFFNLFAAAKLQQILSGLGSIVIIFSSIYIYIKKREKHVAIFIFAYGTLLTGVIIQILMWQGVINFISGKILFYAASLENILMLLAMADKIHNTEKQRLKSHQKMKHSYRQLAKVFYPHQLSAMENGKELEMTMPVGEKQACVLAFDIAGSSKIRGEGAKHFFRDIFSSCSQLMTADYRGSENQQQIVSNAFRIKEMGDGVIASIGWPYQSPTGDDFMDSLAVAEKFIKMFKEKVKDFNYPDNIYCGCGIAYGSVDAFFPRSSPVEYDMYGKGIVLAVRYESMRKIVLPTLNLTGDIMIISETIFDKLNNNRRASFQKFDFKEHNVEVRDDPDATCLYFKIIES